MSFNDEHPIMLELMIAVTDNIVLVTSKMLSSKRQGNEA